MATFLVIGDPHIRSKFMREAETMVSLCISLAKEMMPDGVIILGDILDTHEIVRTFPFNLACRFIEEMANITRTFLLIGNHDYINGSQFLTTNHPFNALKNRDNIFIIDTPMSFIINDMTFSFCPYVPPGRFMEALENIEWRESKCIFAHQEFKGAHYGMGESTTGDDWERDYPPVISGHIHEEQHLPSGVHYVGTPYQHSYTESCNKYIWKVEFGTGKKKKKREFDAPFSYEKISLGMKGKKSYNLTIDEFNERRDAIEEESENVELRLLIRGKRDEIASFRKSPLSKISGVRINFSFLDEATVNIPEKLKSLTKFKDVLDVMVKEHEDELLEKLYHDLMI